MISVDLFLDIHARNTEHGTVYRVALFGYKGRYLTGEMTEKELRHWLNTKFEAERNNEVDGAIERARLTGNSETPQGSPHDLNGSWEDHTEAKGCPSRQDPQEFLSGFSPLQVHKPM